MGQVLGTWLPYRDRVGVIAVNIVLLVVFPAVLYFEDVQSGKGGALQWALRKQIVAGICY